jgi:hypothetical protein
MNVLATAAADSGGGGGGGGGGSTCTCTYTVPPDRASLVQAMMMMTMAVLTDGWIADAAGCRTSS